MSEIMVRERFLRSGKKVYEYSFEMASVDGKRKRKSKSGFASKRDARIAGRKALSEYENVGQVMVDRDISYADFLDLWMENDCKLTCKESTLYGYEKKIRLYLKPELGGYRVSSIDKKILQTFITDLYNDGFSINTIISIKGLLTKSFNYALENHYIMTSPANKLVIPQNMQPDKPTRRKEHIYLTKDNIDSLFERFPKGTSSFVPLQIAYHTGMRPGEVFGLVWDDIDFDNKVINVNRQIQWRQVKRSKKDIKKTNGTSESLGYWYFTSPKYKSYRVIDIDDVLVSILKEEYEKQKRDEKYYGEFYKKYYSEFQLLFSVQKNKEKEIPLNEVSTKETDFGVDFVCRREDGSYVTSRTLQNVSNAVHKELDLSEFMRELRKDNYSNIAEKYFKLGNNLNQRDAIAVRKLISGFIKLIYPDGEVSKEEVAEIMDISLELRRRVKEQLKKIGGMEFYDVNFSYIDNDSFDEHFVSVPEQGGGKMIPEGMGKPGCLYTVSKSKTGMIGCYRLETQMMPGNGKLTCTGIGSGKEPKEATNTAFNYLKANGNAISGSISTTTKDYIINYQDMQGLGMTGNLALPTLIAISSAALSKPPISSLAVLGEISIGGTLIKVEDLASTLQVCLDSGAKKVLLPITSAADLGTVPSDLVGAFSLIFYSSPEEAVYKALGVE